MLQLNELHEGVIKSLLVSKWPDSKLYNMLPTKQNRKLRSYLSQWKEFNQTIIEHARGVRDPLHISPSHADVCIQGGWVCPVEEIYRAVDPRKEITEEEVFH